MSVATDAVAAAKWCGLPLYARETTNTGAVTLTGTLVRKFAWGPPNFGEQPKTDRRWFPWILRLDYAIPMTSVDDDPPAVPSNQVEIQVRGQPEINGDYSRFQKKHVAVTGTLQPATNPSDVTAFVLETTFVRLALRQHCDGRRGDGSR